ncbi:hypothetical protein LMG24235_01916 [Paraburkholderia sabiae]|nr:hypothetical protein LMG24235_01916 [Paraburkholderia sabiae]
MPYDHQPIFVPHRLGASAYFVRVTWPDGFETEVHGFASEADARTWILDHGPRWQEWAPHRVKASLQLTRASIEPDDRT